MLFSENEVLVTRAHWIRNAQPHLTVETASEVSEKRSRRLLSLRRRFSSKKSDIFYGESSPSPDQADDRHSQFRRRAFDFVDRISGDPSFEEQSSRISKRCRRCLLSESAECDDQRSDISRPRSLAKTCSTPLTEAPQARAQVPKISQITSPGHSLLNYSSCLVTRKAKSSRH